MSQLLCTVLTCTWIDVLIHGVQNIHRYAKAMTEYNANTHHMCEDPPALVHDQAQAERLGRKLTILTTHGDPGAEVVRLAREGRYDLIIAGLPEGRSIGSSFPVWMDQVMRNAHCPMFLAAHPLIPKEVEQ